MGKNIFAELTPPGRGGIATLSLLGPEVYDLLQQIFRAKSGTAPQPGQLAYGYMVREDGTVIDEVIVCAAVTEAGTVDELEIHCHGGPASVQGIAARLAELGLTGVAWPEYLAERAARQGTSQIELEADLLLPGLATLAATMLVVSQRNGVLAKALDGAARHMAAGELPAAAAAIDKLLSAYERIGRHMAQPPRIAILGARNVGKSSLMNRLVGHERTIVSAIPGTTRDVVTETSSVGGLPVVLADTAGLRPAGDQVEQLGVERARAEAFRADVQLYLVDLSRAPLADEKRWAAERPARSIVVGAKADLAETGNYPLACDVAISAVTGQGLDELSALMLTTLGFRWPAAHEAVPFTARQAAGLRAAREALIAGCSVDASAALTQMLASAART